MKDSADTGCQVKCAAEPGAGAGVVGGGAASSNSSMFSKITPKTAKMEYMKSLATLLKLPKEHSIILTRNVENVLQGLVDRMLKPCLPYLQLSLVIRELTKEVDSGGDDSYENGLTSYFVP